MPSLQSLLKFAFWTALIVAFTMALLPAPPRLPGDPPDKILHVLAFVVLTGLAIAAYPRASRIAQALGLFGLGALIEFLQMIPALNRDAQFSDWVADSGAVLFVMGAWWLLRQVTRPRTA